MKIPPAGLSARPPPHSFVLDGNDTLVGWSDEIQFDHKFFEAETWPITQSRRDYYMLSLAVTTSHSWPISRLPPVKMVEITRGRILFLALNILLLSKYQN